MIEMTNVQCVVIVLQQFCDAAVSETSRMHKPRDTNKFHAGLGTISLLPLKDIRDWGRDAEQQMTYRHKGIQNTPSENNRLMFDWKAIFMG